MRCESKGMVRIGQWDEPVRRRSLWARILPERPTLPEADATPEEFSRALAILEEWRPEAVELCAGREGDDAFVRIERGQPGFLELVDVVRYAIWNLPKREEAEVERGTQNRSPESPP